MIGKMLGRFEVVERITAGGMGEIYRARHQQLDLDVAVKVLPNHTTLDQKARKMFRKEALTLAKLKHDHIGAIYDFGTEEDVDYLIMELIQGTDLSERLQDGALPEEEALRLGKQIAEALEEAHEKQIVHLDLKPRNIMVTPKGQVKVVDFGLARLVRPIDDVTTQTLSEIQGIGGTLPYMAPEQLRDGAVVDARTDVYGLGVTLYEMVTGHRPFDQGDASKLITAILHSAPPRPRAIQAGVSDGFERVILKSIQKNPARRYQSARELREDLERFEIGLPVSAPQRWPRGVNRWSLGTAGAIATIGVLLGLNVGGIRGTGSSKPLISSVAVLPFSNLSGDPDQEFFVDGMTDQMTVSLAGLANLKVIGRQSVMPYKGTSKTLGEIGKELGVSAVLQASVLRDSNQVQIIAQLTDTKSGSLLWGETLTRDMSGMLSLLNEATASIAERVKITLRPEEEERLRDAPAIQPQALEAYIKGRLSQFKWTADDIQRGITFYRRAIELDPNYAAAYAGIGECYWFLGSVGLEAIAPDEAYSKAMPELRKALEIDPLSAEAHALLGMISVEYDRDWTKAEEEYKRAIDLQPSFAMVRIWYSQLLSAAGRHDEAIEQVQIAKSLDPYNDFVNTNLVGRFYMAGNFARAIEVGRQALEANPEDWVTEWFVGMAQLDSGNYDDAISTLERCAHASDDNPYILSNLGKAYARAGDRQKAITILNGLKQRDHIPGFPVADLCATLGDLDEAFAWLEIAYNSHANLMEIKSLMFSALHSDPRFDDLVRRIGIPDVD